MSTHKQDRNSVPHPRQRTHRRNQRGAALVEGTLVVLTVVLMTIFVLDMGQLLMFMQLFNDRVRDAARYSAVNPFEEEAIRNYTAYNTASPKDAQSSGLLGLESSHVGVTRYDQNGNHDRIEIRIEQFPLQIFSPFLAGRYRHRPFRAVLPVESLGAKN